MRPDDVVDDDDPWAADVFGLAQQIRRWTGNEASMLQVDQGEIREMVARQAPMVESLTRDAVDLVGIPIRTLLVPRAAT